MTPIRAKFRVTSMTPIRAKFRVTSISQDMNGAKVCLVQVPGGVVRDKMFLAFASGEIKIAMHPGAQEIGAFKPGMDFYVDFVESEDACFVESEDA